MAGRVAVIAPSAVVRAGLEALLAESPDLTVLHASSAEQRGADGMLTPWEFANATEPDVIVWAPAAGEVASVAAVELALAAGLPSNGDERTAIDSSASGPPAPGDAPAAAPPVVLVADPPSPGWTVAALRAGVRAVVPTTATAAELSAAVSAALAGLVSLPGRLADALLAQVPAAARSSGAEDSSTLTERLPSAVDPASLPLTGREREVLALLAEGLANKQIAPRLGISEHTVKAHVASIFAKLHAGTRAEAVVTAARRGLLML